jgi:hypothetical protein
VLVAAAQRDVVPGALCIQAAEAHALGMGTGQLAGADLNARRRVDL